MCVREIEARAKWTGTCVMMTRLHGFASVDQPSIEAEIRSFKTLELMAQILCEFCMYY